MTPRQRDAFDFIVNYIDATGGIAPSFEEIAAGIELRSKSSVARLMDGLQAGGYIRRRPHRNRGTEVLRGPPNFLVVDLNDPNLTPAMRDIFRQFADDQAARAAPVQLDMEDAIRDAEAAP